VSHAIADKVDAPKQLGAAVVQRLFDMKRGECAGDTTFSLT